MSGNMSKSDSALSMAMTSFTAFRCEGDELSSEDATDFGKGESDAHPRSSKRGSGNWMLDDDAGVFEEDEKLFQSIPAMLDDISTPQDLGRKESIDNCEIEEDGKLICGGAEFALATARGMFVLKMIVSVYQYVLINYTLKDNLSGSLLHPQ